MALPDSKEQTPASGSGNLTPDQGAGDAPASVTAAPQNVPARVGPGLVARPPLQIGLLTRGGRMRCASSE
jgi:hypothetical protein